MLPRYLLSVLHKKAFFFNVLHDILPAFCHSCKICICSEWTDPVTRFAFFGKGVYMLWLTNKTPVYPPKPPQNNNPPDAPLPPQVAVGIMTAAVTWTPPESYGQVFKRLLFGFPFPNFHLLLCSLPSAPFSQIITSYDLEVGRGSEDFKNCYTGRDPTASVDGLLPSTSYLFRVRASSANGIGNYSQPSSALTLNGMFLASFVHISNTLLMCVFFSSRELLIFLLFFPEQQLRRCRLAFPS